jgi:hypothetical protein
MSDSEQWEKVLTKLLEETKTGDISWSAVSRPNREDIVGFAYAASVKNKRLFVYEYRYRHYSDENEWEYQTDIAVELVSPDGTLEWRIPPSRARHQLLEAIREKTSGAEDFLVEYLEPMF